MKFLDYKNSRYLNFADVVNWLSEFAQSLEDGKYPDGKKRDAQLVWNIVAALMYEDLRNKPPKRSE